MVGDDGAVRTAAARRLVSARDATDIRQIFDRYESSNKMQLDATISKKDY
jgi:hypothetical protein